MTRPLVDRIVEAVLYEGYLLYPYRPSAVKNRQRWTFGGVVPREYGLAHDGGDSWSMQTQCLVRGEGGTAVGVRVRFLHPLERRLPNGWSWREAVERDVGTADWSLDELTERPRRLAISFPAGESAGSQRGVEGVVECSAERLRDGWRLTVVIQNLTQLPNAESITRDEAMLYAFVSTHTILTVNGGEFLSLLDPPEPWRDAADACRNVGCWPVLVGEPGQSDTLLSSPIILYDYPQVAPESPGDFFDATEIDEMLTLRILTMTDEEKREMAATDERARTLLERTESLGRDDLMRLHGTIRGLRPVAWEPERRRLECVHLGPVELTRGDRVRLRPRGGADVMDLALRGKVATIAAIEQDFEDVVYLAVTVDDDPGKDFGERGLPGHRFFFRLDEVEPIADQGASS